MTPRRRAVTAAFLLIAGTSEAATPAASSPTCTVIRAGKVTTPAGTTAGLVVRTEGARITHVAATVPEAGCAIVDAPTSWLTPGLVEVGTEMGLVEVGMEGASVDADAEQGDPIRAEFRAWDAYNPRSTVIPVTRMEGITSAIAAPRGGLVAGQGAWVRLAGATQAETLVRGPIGIWANPMSAGSKAEGLARLRELIADARLYAAKRADWERGDLRDLSGGRGDLEALQAVLNRTIPLVLPVDRAADIEAVLRFAAEERVFIVISGGAEAWMVADRIAAARVPVIVDPFGDGPGGFDAVHAREDNAAILHRAGVTILISSFSTHHGRTLRFVAGNAVRSGLPHHVALQAITTTPAEVFSVAQHGGIAPGQEADLALWSGDPLECLTLLDRVWIRGAAIAMESRQTELLTKYRTLPGTPEAPLPLPAAR